MTQINSELFCEKSRKIVMTFLNTFALTLQLISAPGNTLHVSDIDLIIPRNPYSAFVGDVSGVVAANDITFFFSPSGIISTTRTLLASNSFQISQLPRKINTGSKSLFYMKDPLSTEFVFTNQSRTEIFYGSVTTNSPVVDLKSCGPFVEISDIHITETAGAIAYLIVADKGANTIYSYVLDPSGTSLCTSQQSLSLESPQWIRSISGSPPTIYIGYRTSSGLQARSFQASNLATISAEQTLSTASRAKFGNPTIDATSSEVLIPILNIDNKSDAVITYNSALSTSSQFTSCRSPQSIGIDYAGTSRYRYVFCPQNQVIQIRDTSNALITSLTAGPFPKQILIGSDGTNRFISVLQTNGRVLLHQFAIAQSPIVPTTTSINLTGNGTSMAQYIGATTAADQLMVTIPEDNAVSIIDLSAQTLSSTLTFPKSVDSLAAASSSLLYFASSQSNAAYALQETATGLWSINIYPTGNYPIQLGYRTNRLYTLNRDSNSVSVINLTSGAVSSLATGSRPIHFDMDTTTNRLWAVNETGQSVTVLDITVGSEAVASGSPVALGFTPKKILYRSADTTLFALGSSSLRTINAPTLATVTTHSLSSASKDMVLESSGVAVSSLTGNLLYLATRTTIATQSLTSAPHFLVSNGTIAVAGQRSETKLTTSTGISQTVDSFDRLASLSSSIYAYHAADKTLFNMPYSLLSSARFPAFKFQLEIDPEKMATDSTGNIWLANSTELKFQRISSSQQLSVLRNEILNRPETPDVWDAQNKIYIPLRNLNALAILNATTGTASVVSVCQSPRKAMIDTSQSPAKVFVLCPDGDLLSVLTLNGSGDFSSQALVGVGKFPIAMVLNPSPVDRIFIANQDSDSVSILNSTTNATVATVTVQTSPIDLALNTATNTVEVVHQNSPIITHMSSSGSTTSTTIGDLGFSKVSVNTSNNRIFAMNKSFTGFITYPTLSVLSSGSVLIDNETPYSLFTASSQNKTYISYPSADVIRIISDTGTLTDVSVGSHPVFAFPFVGATKVFVSNYEDDTLSVLNLTTDAVTATISLTAGCGPSESRVIDVGGTNFLYVMCQKNDSIEVINTSTNAVGTPISLRLSD